ncbi:MAG: hydrogenase maturation protease [Thermovirgaceae bacterium]|nr:hydrogenase maturation protease [Thermovirgaceae bacterium]
MFRIFGYGNPFRQDDGAGHLLAPMLLEDLHKAGNDACLVLGHQLLPEAACDIRPGDILVFVDASLERYPNGYILEPVHPDGTANQGLNIHSFGPSWFLALLEDLGTGFREAWALSISGDSFDFDDAVTDTCRQRIERARTEFRERFCRSEN